MYQLPGVLLLTVLSMVSVQGQDNVVMLKKMVDISTLSVKEFHRLNKGHIIYNYISKREKFKDHLRTFHDLLYAGKVSIGAPEQPLKVFFDTSSADVMVMSATRCTSFFVRLFTPICWNHRYYDELKSLRGDKLKEFCWSEGRYPSFELDYGKAILSGFLLYDQVKIASTTIDAALIGLIDHWEYSFAYSRTDGIVGIGPKKLSNFLTGKSISRAHLTDQAKIKSHSPLAENLAEMDVTHLGIYLYRDKKGKEVGQLLVGTEDDNEVRKSEVVWFKPVSKDARHWTLPMTTIKFIHMSDGEVSAVSFSNSYSVPDPGVSLFAGPPELIDHIHDQLFIGLKFTKKARKHGTVEFDCGYRHQLPILVFMMANEEGKHAYFLEPKEYVRELNGKCASGFMAVENLPVLIIGDSFLQRYYTVLDNATKEIGLAESVPVIKK